MANIRHLTAASVSLALQNSTALSALTWHRAVPLAPKGLSRMLLVSLTATVTSCHRSLVSLFASPLENRKPLLTTVFCCNIANTAAATATGTGNIGGPTIAANSSGTTLWPSYTPVRTQSGPIPSVSAAMLNRTNILVVMVEIVCVGILFHLLM